MNFSHRIEGGEELELFLKKFPLKVERQLLVKALRGPVKNIKNRVRREIKSAYTKRTGVLLRSVKHRAVKARYGAAIIIEMNSIYNATKRIGNKIKRRAKVKELKIKKEKGKFKDAYYARFLIKGTKNGIKANPFLDRAMEAEEKESIKKFQHTMIESLEQEAMKQLLR